VADYVLLNGDGYESGTVQERKHHRVSRTLLRTLSNQLDAAGFWTSPAQQRLPEENEDVTIICTDGTRYVFEALVDDTYHVVVPDTCPDMTIEFRRLVSTFLRIGRVPRD
jgi:hypothetical protein